MITESNLDEVHRVSTASSLTSSPPLSGTFVAGVPRSLAVFDGASAAIVSRFLRYARW